MKHALLLSILFSAIAAQASFLPLLNDLRAAVAARQEAISNAPPITTEGKKELAALRKALASIDAPSTTVAGDLSALSKAATAISKAPNNAALAFEVREAVSNYIGVVVQTNDALASALATANNNPALKQKATTTLEAAQAQLANVNPETDIAAAAKALVAVLKSYMKAARAVTAAVNAEPVPLPNPKSGTLIVEAGGERHTFSAATPTRTFPIGIGGTDDDGNSTGLAVSVPLNGGPGTYQYTFNFTKMVNGTSTIFEAAGTDAQVTSVSSSAVAGTISGTGRFRQGINVIQENVPFTVVFNAKILFRVP